MSTRERDFHPVRGHKIRLGELQRMGDAVSRLSGVHAPGLIQGGHGLTFVQPQPDWFWIKVTAKDASSPKKYTWSLVVPDGVGGFQVPAGGPSGTPAALPAYEINGKDVDVTGPVYAQAFFTTQRVWFIAPGGTAAPNFTGITITWTNCTFNLVNTDVNFDGDSSLTIRGQFYFPKPATSPRTIASGDNVTLIGGPLEYWDAAGALNLRSIVAQADGYRLCLVNRSAYSWKIVDDEASLPAANRLWTWTRHNIYWPPEHILELIYDGVVSRWRILSCSDPQEHRVKFETPAASVNNFAIEPGSPCQRWETAAATTVTGLAGGVRGQVIYVANYNATSPIDRAFTLTLAHDSGSSTAGNRFYCPNGEDYKIAAGGGVVCYYDGTQWQVLANRELYTTQNALVAVGPLLRPVEKAGLLINGNQLRGEERTGATRPEMAGLYAASGTNNLAGGEYVQRFSGYGRANSADNMLGGVDVKYVGNGTTTRGQTELFAVDDSSTKRIGLTVERTGDLKVENASGSDQLTYTDSSKLLKNVTLGSGLTFVAGTLSAATALTATYIAYGNGSNVLAGTADWTRTGEAQVTLKGLAAAQPSILSLHSDNNASNWGDGSTAATIEMSGRHGGSIQGGTRIATYVQDTSSDTAYSGAILTGVTGFGNEVLKWSSSGKLRVNSASTASRVLGTDSNGNVATVAQYSTTGTVTGHTGGGGTTVTHSDTFTGNTGSTAYTIGDIVRALKLCNIIVA